MTDVFQPDLFNPDAEPVEADAETGPEAVSDEHIAAIAASGAARVAADIERDTGEGRELSVHEEAVGRIPTQGELPGLRSDASDYRYDQGPGRNPRNQERWQGHLDTDTRESGRRGLEAARANMPPSEAERRRVEALLDRTRRQMGHGTKPLEAGGAEGGDRRAEREALNFIADHKQQ